MQLTDVIKLKEGEIVRRVARGYWFVRLPTLALAAALVYAPFFLMLPLSRMGRWGSAVFAVSVIAGLLLALRAAIMLRWNAFIVTSQRVIDIDQRGFFERVVSDAPYDRIEDVSYHVRGVMGALFHFGSVIVQLDGDHVRLELRDVHQPRELHHLIAEGVASVAPRAAPGGRSEKVQALLDSVSDMNDAEARAFLVGLQGAMKGAEGSEGVRKGESGLGGDDASGDRGSGVHDNA